MLSIIAILTLASTVGTPTVEEVCVYDNTGVIPVQICEDDLTQIRVCARDDLSTGYIRFPEMIFDNYNIQNFPVRNFRLEGSKLVADIAWQNGDLIFTQGDSEWDSCESLL